MKTRTPSPSTSPTPVLSGSPQALLSGGPEWAVLRQPRSHAQPIPLRGHLPVSVPIALSVHESPPGLWPSRPQQAAAPTHRARSNGAAASSSSPSPSLSSSLASSSGTDGLMKAKYFGHGTLSVRSTTTQLHYRFSGHGDVQWVDKRDQLMLL